MTPARSASKGRTSMSIVRGLIPFAVCFAVIVACGKKDDQPQPLTANAAATGGYPQQGYPQQGYPQQGAPMQGAPQGAPMQGAPMQGAPMTAGTMAVPGPLAF